MITDEYEWIYKQGLSNTFSPHYVMSTPPPFQSSFQMCRFFSHYTKNKNLCETAVATKILIMNRKRN